MRYGDDGRQIWLNSFGQSANPCKNSGMRAAYNRIDIGCYSCQNEDASAGNEIQMTERCKFTERNE